ncbi:hypothetical protein Dxin01_02872 [Deinococcus xinjiangensis]|uniref:HNH endonuclease n=1 Tax=Deinococcus xinjiangensis TaxID=457454 RepID=A0ABP9VIC8_9DEIO
MKLADIRDLPELIARMDAKTDRSPSEEPYKGSGCHVWTGAASNGYGQVSVQGEKVGAHRMALAIETGTFGEQAMHTCDHPLCVNPAHLSWGTNADNTRDKAGKGRASRLSGSANGRAVLSDSDVVSIRAAPAHRGIQTKLARQYKVSQSTISLIRSGKTW